MYSTKSLPNLVGLRLTLEVLNIDSGVTHPRHFENNMATRCKSRLAKVIDTNFLQICELHVGWLCVHLSQQLQNLTHWIVSLTISFLNGMLNTPLIFESKTLAETSPCVSFIHIQLI